MKLMRLFKKDTSTLRCKCGQKIEHGTMLQHYAKAHYQRFHPTRKINWKLLK